MKNQITICIFTHIIEVETNPHLDNKMLVNTIKSTSEVLNLKEVKYQIYIDAAMKRLYPELYQKYLDKQDFGPAFNLTKNRYDQFKWRGKVYTTEQKDKAKKKK